MPRDRSQRQGERNRRARGSGNFEDEDCDGKTPGKLLDPFPTVVFPTSAYSDRTITSKLKIKDVHRGY